MIGLQEKVLWMLTKAFRCRWFFSLTAQRKCWKITWSKCDRNTIRDKCWCMWQGFPIKPTTFSPASLLLFFFSLCTAFSSFLSLRLSLCLSVRSKLITVHGAKKLEFVYRKLVFSPLRTQQTAKIQGSDQK